jgi:hypothetical protein
VKLPIIAIDPGPVQSAIVCWDGTAILDTALEDNATILDLVTLSTGQLYIEMFQGMGMPVGAEVFQSCVWIGRFLQAYEDGSGGRHAILVRRNKIKGHHCNREAAKDGNIRQALIDRFGAPWTWTVPDPAKPKKRVKVGGVTFGLHDDLWQAFALAVYAFDTQSQELPCLAPGS